jgi:D-3-phosphoglycerate dehydrogenase
VALNQTPAGLMNRSDRIAVCSRSFSRNELLRAELLSRYERVTFNDTGEQLEADRLVAFLAGHDKAIVGLETIDPQVLERLPELKVVSKYGVGLDRIDLAAMRAHGKRLGWTGGVNRRSVSELVIAFAITMLRHVPAAHHEVLSGTWRQRVGGYLSGKTVGIVGCGHIGKDLVPLLRAFGCVVLANDIRDFPDFYAAHDVEAVELEELLARADIVTLHVPLDDSTSGMLDARRLALLKPTAVLINTARGGIVDETALKHLLREGRLAAAAFDVFAIEPPQDLELLALPNFLATPHIGGSAAEAILAMGRAAIDGLDDNHIPVPAAV